jgi:hypothetical protein
LPSHFVDQTLQRLASVPGARQLVQRLRYEQDETRAAVGRLETHLLELRQSPPARLDDVEFRVFSQFGEDGIIQYLVRKVAPAQTSFVEIGTGDYRESNTRFLLQNNNWRGLAIDGGEAHVEFVRSSPIAWRYDVEPVSAFVTRDNVNELISGHGFTGEIGLLSIDVDGIDYWLWEAIDVVDPAIVVSEYNALWGADATITVPYDPAFVNSEGHWSQQYFGASLGALVHLGDQRGYRFVGCASNGANAFFVREDVAGDLPSPTPQQGYRESRFLTSRNRDGSLSRLRSTEQRIALIGDLPVIDVTSGSETTVAAALGHPGGTAR